MHADYQMFKTQNKQERDNTQICVRFDLIDILHKIDKAYLAEDTLTVWENPHVLNMSQEYPLWNSCRLWKEVDKFQRTSEAELNLEA